MWMKERRRDMRAWSNASNELNTRTYAVVCLDSKWMREVKKKNVHYKIWIKIV
jgi:hypothetical protein